MPFPKQGMHFNDVRKRVNRIANTPGGDKPRKNQLIYSLLNQAKLNDGNDAVKELKSELNHNNRSFSGSGNRQLGIGRGKTTFCPSCNDRAYTSIIRHDGITVCGICGGECLTRDRVLGAL